MPLNASQPTVDVDAFDAKVAAAETSSYADFALWGGVIPGNRDQLEGLAERGVLGFKAFMSTTGSDDFPRPDDVTLLEAKETIAPLGLPLLLHAESDSITGELARRARTEGRRAVRDYLDSRPPVAGSEAIARALELAAMTGCWVHIVHVSTPRGVQLVARARAGGVKANCEVTAHHLLFKPASDTSQRDSSDHLRCRGQALRASGQGSARSRTLLRGRVVYEDGVTVGPPGGKLLRPL